MNSAFVPLSVLMADRVLPGAVLITGLVNAALFACLSGATYVLQGIFGLSPQGYSFAFGLNCTGFMVFGFASGRLSERRSENGNPRPRPWYDASTRGRAAGYRGSAPAVGSHGAVPAHQGQQHGRHHSAVPLARTGARPRDRGDRVLAYGPGALRLRRVGRPARRKWGPWHRRSDRDGRGL
jgi:hypothetical protein